MAQRTTIALVQGVLAPNQDYDGKANLQPFLDTAVVLVDDIEASAVEDEAPLSAAKLELIERWAAAHFYKCSDRPLSSSSAGKGRASYDGKTDKYMEATLYGQTAMALDSSGYLRAQASSAERRVAGGSWLGTLEEDQP
jgi:hypothetical protein